MCLHFWQEILTIKADFEKLSQSHLEKSTTLSEKESEILSLNQTLTGKESAFVKLQSDLDTFKQTCDVLSDEKAQLLNSIKKNEEVLIILPIVYFSLNFTFYLNNNILDRQVY